MVLVGLLIVFVDDVTFILQIVNRIMNLMDMTIVVIIRADMTTIMSAVMIIILVFMRIVIMMVRIVVMSVVMMIMVTSLIIIKSG